MDRVGFEPTTSAMSTDRKKLVQIPPAPLFFVFCSLYTIKQSLEKVTQVK
jgi:hypothetical protein